MHMAKCGFNDVEGGASGQLLLTAFGPTLLVDIGFDPNFVQTSGIVPTAGITGIQALVDTGAGESCIDNLLAAQLNLPIVDRRHVSGSSGKHEVNVYLARVHVPILPFTIWGAFAGVELKAGGQMHSALIGRTFLQNFKMEYNGLTGDVTITSP
jgi:predicted aspartyl protease